MSGASTNQTVLSEPDESTRLLPDLECEGGSVSPRVRGRTPLPKAQLGALIAVRMVDPIAYTQIFPYINQLLADLHIAAPERVGFYSGFIESAFALAEVFSVYQWGRVSDIVGRRPVLLLSLIGIALATICFGLSTSLVTIVASRFLGGLVAGNIAVCHSMLVEITDDTNQDIAVPIYSLSWSTGTIIGSLVGGTFANAATRYPKYFSWPIFVDYPYLPPSAISAACTFLGVGLGYLFIKETLPSKRKHSTRDIVNADSGSAQSGPASTATLLATPTLQALILSGFILSILASAFDVVFTLFCYTPLDAGGLGLQPSDIGKFLAFAGTFAVLLRLAAMPYILRRYDYAATYNTCMYLWPVAFLALPAFNAFVHSGMSLADGAATATSTTAAQVCLWISLAFILALSRVAMIPFSITMLLTKRYAPSVNTATPSDTGGTGRPTTTVTATRTGSGSGSGSALGRSNGLVQFAICIGRTIGPIVVSALFTALNSSAWARQWGLGWTWSVVMACIGVVGVRVTRKIR